MAAPDAESDISEELENLLTMAFTLMLETLRPVERAVFLLREVFDYKYADTAAIVGKEERMTRTALSVSGKGEVLVRDRAHFREANPFVASCEEPRPAFG